MFAKFLTRAETVEVFQEDLNGEYYWTESLDDSIVRERILAINRSQAGCERAAYELLKLSGVAIMHIDLDDPVPPEPADLEDGFGGCHGFYRAKLLGFNDHGGGSESLYKILLNTDDGQRVLYSPPDEHDRPSNVTFRNADFTFLPWEAKLEDRYQIPNPLKTASASQAARGVLEYEHYLFTAGCSARQRVVNALIRAGFSFANTPYDDTSLTGELWTLRDAERSAQRREERFSSRRVWPLLNSAEVREGAEPIHQFAEQLHILEQYIAELEA